jgi:hypothetical protein
MAFEQWCVIELFGHQQIAGKVTEQEIGGTSFVRVDVPQTNRNEKFTKYFGAGAIYSITPVDEETARLAVESYAPEPIESWRLQLPERGTSLYQDDVDDIPF